LTYIKYKNDPKSGRIYNLIKKVIKKKRLIKIYRYIYIYMKFINYYPYIIYSDRYNKKTKTITEYYGVAKIFKGATKKPQLQKIIIKNNKRDYEDNRIQNIILIYDNYYLLESERNKYNAIIKRLDNKIYEAKKKLLRNDFIIEQNKIIASQDKYKIITHDRQLFLKNIVTKYQDDIKIKWLPPLNINDDDNNITEESYKYIDDETNKNKIIYHNLSKYKTHEELINKTKELQQIWKENNKDKLQEYAENYRDEYKDKINERKKNKYYLKKTEQVYTTDEIKRHEQSITDIIKDNDKKKAVNILCDMIKEDSNIRVIINKLIDAKYKSSIRSRLKYLGK
jgi:hypothetical protein